MILIFSMGTRVISNIFKSFSYVSFSSQLFFRTTFVYSHQYEIEVIMPGPCRAVTEDYRRHHCCFHPWQVSKSGNFIHHCFFGYFKYMPEEIHISTEIPDCGKNRSILLHCLSAHGEWSPTGVSYNDPMFLLTSVFISSAISVRRSLIRRQED